MSTAVRSETEIKAIVSPLDHLIEAGKLRPEAIERARAAAADAGEERLIAAGALLHPRDG